MKSDTSSIRRNRSLPIIEPELLGRVLASAADLSIVMTPDGTTTAVLVNPNAESMGNLGHWEGRPLRDFLTEESIPKLERVLRKAAIGEGDRAELRDEIEAALVGGPPEPRGAPIHLLLARAAAMGRKIEAEAEGRRTAWKAA